MLHWQPIFEIERDHHFAEIEKHLATLKDLQGPVYEIDREHHCNEIAKHVSGIQNLVGPVYDVFHDHKFNKVMDRISGPRGIRCPYIHFRTPDLERPTRSANTSSVIFSSRR